MFYGDPCLSDLFHAKIEGNAVNTKSKQTWEMIPEESADKSLQSDFQSGSAGEISFGKADVIDFPLLFHMETLSVKQCECYISAR